MQKPMTDSDILEADKAIIDKLVAAGELTLTDKEQYISTQVVGEKLFRTVMDATVSPNNDLEKLKKLPESAIQQMHKLAQINPKALVEKLEKISPITSDIEQLLEGLDHRCEFLNEVRKVYAKQVQ